jgi:ABC-2 type transport system ATP-binding protein
MSEMALTADHVVVIGRGRLIADQPVSEIITQSSRRFVRVRTPDAADLEPLLRSGGATVEVEHDGTMTVTGLTSEVIGDLCAQHRIRLHELTPLSASLEEAFMDLTRESVEFRGTPQDPTPGPALPVGTTGVAR